MDIKKIGCLRKRVDICIVENTDRVAKLRWGSGHGEVVEEYHDLTDWTAEMQVRKKTADPEPLLELTTENGRMEIPEQDAENIGRFNIIFKAEDTKGICDTHKSIDAEYDLFLIDTENIRRSHFFGVFTIEPAITRIIDE